jgi:3-oxoacyl-[acyl-carrier-protein] synthase-3
VPDLIFDNCSIAGIVTTVGGDVRAFDDEASSFGLTEKDAARLKRSMHFGTRHVVRDPGTTTADLCRDASERLLKALSVAPQSIDALIMVTQTPNYASPSTAIRLQHELNMRVESACFDIRMGCSGFIYGLSAAFSYVQAGYERVLLCVGDVASRMVPPDDHTITPLMGDAGAAILVERKAARSRFQLYSDGSGERGLFIPNSGLKRELGDELLGNFMKMDGAAVFNFTLKRVPDMLQSLLTAEDLEALDVDRFVLHQPNRYILNNVQKRMGLNEERMPSQTQQVYGNQNSASIPGTISGFLSDLYSNHATKSVFAGFGVGLSWGACAIETHPMHAPPPFLYQGCNQ